MGTTTSGTTTEYTVTGMTCGHCVTSITQEVEKVAGVTGVNVDLATGKLTVTSEGGVEDTAVAEAVTEAGYELASAPEEPAASCCGTCH
ncbi:hypothetical protein GCM10009716_10510 [Streptomyces sodiiphilus]|uniref:HMA domain-containing protein n=1 Tax=Streptomyces sodiiphilus TaxID=226217 RepID=A0ABN2NW18_9ACTN